MSFFNNNTGFLSSLNKGPKNRPPFEAFYIYILALLTGFLLSDLGILYVRPAMLPQQAPPSRPSSAPRTNFTSLGQYQKIRDRNLFNWDGKVPPPLTSDGSDSQTIDSPPVASQLPLKLEGTLVHANPKKSVATVTSKSKNEAKSYTVDDDIDGMAKVVKVERRKLIFRNLNSQRLEFIEIPKDSTVTFGVKETGPATGEEVQRKGEFEFTMRRGEVLKYTADLGTVLQQARMIPNIIPGSGGRVDGFRFVAIQPNSIYEKLGFKPMDVIRTVNGEPVNSPTKAMELYNALKQEGRFSIGVERNGREESFKYDITE